MAIIDLFAILPFFLPLLIDLDLRFIRIIRSFRLFRILKIARYNDSLLLFVRVFKNEKEKLLLTMFLVFVMLLLTSSVMFTVENMAQDEEVFTDILFTMWWAISTLTTVGYGDIYPVTALGRALGGIIAILGVGLVALPTGILSAGLIKEIENEKANKNKCPHCGSGL